MRDESLIALALVAAMPAQAILWLSLLLWWVDPTAGHDEPLDWWFDAPWVEHELRVLDLEERVEWLKGLLRAQLRFAEEQRERCFGVFAAVACDPPDSNCSTPWCD